MSGRIAHLLPLTLVLLLGALTLWLRFAIETPAVIEPGKNRHDPDAIAENVSTLRMDGRGNPHFQLSARRMLHYPDSDSMELEAPRFIRQDAQATLTVTAGRGVINQEIKEGNFYDNVDLLRTPRDGKAALRVQTQYMRVYMDREFVSTDRAVTVTQVTSTLSGVGMEYDRKSGKLTLLSGVKGSFDAGQR